MQDRTTFSGSTVHQSSTIRSFHSSLTLTCWQCSSGCPCSCHRHYRRHRIPTLLDRFLGILFVGYLGLPYLNGPCDSPQCCQRSSPGILISYIFPAWLLARTMIILMRISSSYGPELLIRIPRIISYNASIFQCIHTGNVNEIKRLFERGLSSPFDVDPSGLSGLMVRSHASYGTLTCAKQKF